MYLGCSDGELDSNSSCDQQGQEPLVEQALRFIKAAERGDSDGVRALLPRVASAHAIRECRRLYEGAISVDSDCEEELKKATMPLRYAAKAAAGEGHLAVVQLLLNAFHDAYLTQGMAQAAQSLAVR